MSRPTLQAVQHRTVHTSSACVACQAQGRPHSLACAASGQLGRHAPALFPAYPPRGQWQLGSIPKHVPHPCPSKQLCTTFWDISCTEAISEDGPEFTRTGSLLTVTTGAAGTDIPVAGLALPLTCTARVGIRYTRSGIVHQRTAETPETFTVRKGLAGRWWSRIPLAALATNTTLRRRLMRMGSSSLGAAAVAHGQQKVRRLLLLLRQPVGHAHADTRHAIPACALRPPARRRSRRRVSSNARQACWQGVDEGWAPAERGRD